MINGDTSTRQEGAAAVIGRILKDFVGYETNEFARQCILAMSVVVTANMDPAQKANVLKSGGCVPAATSHPTSPPIPPTLPDAAQANLAHSVRVCFNPSAIMCPAPKPRLSV